MFECTIYCGLKRLEYYLRAHNLLEYNYKQPYEGNEANQIAGKIKTYY